MKKLFLAAAVAAVALSSCNKEQDVNVRYPATDGTVVLLFTGYTVTGRNIPTADITSGTVTCTEPVSVCNGAKETIQGVKVVLENGREFISGADGKITITLPEGQYLYRIEYPTGWYQGYYNSWDDSYTYPFDWKAETVGSNEVFTVEFHKDESKQNAQNYWNVVEVPGGSTAVGQFYLFKAQ